MDVKVSQKVWMQLSKIKLKGQIGNMDAVITKLLEKYQCDAKA